MAFLIKPLRLSLSFTDAHTHLHLFDNSCADVHLDASLPAKGVWAHSRHPGLINIPKRHF